MPKENERTNDKTRCLIKRTSFSHSSFDSSFRTDSLLAAATELTFSPPSSLFQLARCFQLGRLIHHGQHGRVFVLSRVTVFLASNALFVYGYFLVLYVSSCTRFIRLSNNRHASSIVQPLSPLAQQQQRGLHVGRKTIRVKGRSVIIDFLQLGFAPAKDSKKILWEFYALLPDMQLISDDILPDGCVLVDLGNTIGDHVFVPIEPFNLESDPCYFWLKWTHMYHKENKQHFRILQVRDGFDADDRSLDTSIANDIITADSHDAHSAKKPRLQD